MRTAEDYRVETRQIYLELRQIMDEWVEDAKWKLDDLDLAAEKTSGVLEAKYGRHRAEMHIRHQATKSERQKLKRLLHQYYDGKLNSNAQVLKALGRAGMNFAIQKKELDIYLGGDDLYQACIGLEMAYETMILELTGVIEALSRRTYHFQVALAHQKFKAGM